MKPTRFIMHWYVLVFSLLLIAMPFYHRATGRELQQALKINLDSVAAIAGLVGLASFVAISVLNRRLTELEKSMPAKSQ